MVFFSKTSRTIALGSLDVEVYPKMPRNWSKAVPEVSGLVPHQEEFGPEQPTLADLYRTVEERFDGQLKIMESHFDQQGENLNELMEKTRELRRRLAILEQDAWQPRLAVETDMESDKKIRKRTEGAAAAERVMSGDNSSAQADIDAIRLISFGDDSTGPPTLSCLWDDVLVGKGAAAPKSRLSPVEMRTLTAGGGLLLTGNASTATRIIYYQPHLWFCPTKEIHSTLSNQYATDYRSFWKLKVLEPKSR